MEVSGRFDSHGGDEHGTDDWKGLVVDAADETQVIQFLGQKVDPDYVEHNRLIETFCWFQRLCIEKGSS
jgi:hypothetical protein